MGTKLNPDPYDCFYAALPDEPYFVLLARDPSGAGIVSLWASERAAEIKQGLKPESDKALVIRARACAVAMAEWRAANAGKWRMPSPADRAATTALADVVRERNRQVTEEGWTPEHDDQHTDGGLARVASFYAVVSTLDDHERAALFPDGEFQFDRFHILSHIWPASWASRWLKPKDRRRDLVRAAALIIAEIERLDRAAATEAQS